MTLDKVKQMLANQLNIQVEKIKEDSRLIEDLGAMLLTEDPLELHDLPIKSEDIADNAPALVMHANLYAGAGLKIDPIYEGEEDK